MADRKYASDYRLETFVNARGKPEQRRIYQGPDFVFCYPARIRRFAYTVLGVAIGVLLLLLPMFLSDTMITRTIYVLLPVALTLLPVYWLLAVARRLFLTKEPFTREHRDKTQRRLRRASITLTVLLAVAFAGALAYTFLVGVQPGEPVSIACIAVALAASVYLLPQCKLAQAKEKA